MAKNSQFNVKIFKCFDVVENICNSPVVGWKKKYLKGSRSKWRKVYPKLTGLQMFMSCLCVLVWHTLIYEGIILNWTEMFKRIQYL